MLIAFSNYGFISLLFRLDIFSWSGTTSGTTTKFNLVADRDIDMYRGTNQTIETRNYFMESILEWQNKSSGELRYKNYLVNSKGLAQVGDIGCFPLFPYSCLTFYSMLVVAKQY